MPLQELEQLALAVEVGERRAAQDLNELVAVQRAVDPILEVLLACREVVGALGCDPLQPGEDVARDLDRVDRRGPDVRVAEHVDVALGAREAGRHIEQVDTRVGGHIAGAAFGHLGVARLVEQRGHPQLEVEPRRDEQIRLRQRRHEAGLGLHVVRVLIARRDRGDDATVAGDFARDRRIGR